MFNVIETHVQHMDLIFKTNITYVYNDNIKHNDNNPFNNANNTCTTDTESIMSLAYYAETEENAVEKQQ